MEKIVATISNFASAEDHVNLSETVKELNDSLLTFILDHSEFHKEEKEQHNKELNQIKHDLHKLRVALTWAVAGLLCSGIAILSLCIHLFS